MDLLVVLLPVGLPSTGDGERRAAERVAQGASQVGATVAAHQSTGPSTVEVSGGRCDPPRSAAVELPTCSRSSAGSPNMMDGLLLVDEDRGRTSSPARYCKCSRMHYFFTTGLGWTSACWARLRTVVKKSAAGGLDEHSDATHVVTAKVHSERRCF